MLDQVTAFLDVLIGQSGATHMSVGNVVMIAIGAAMVAIAAVKRFEPFLLAGIGFACIIANVPGSPVAFLGGNGALSQAADGGLFHYAWLGIAQLILPPLIFLGIGAMTDFGAVIKNPKLIVLEQARSSESSRRWFLPTRWVSQCRRRERSASLGPLTGPSRSS